VCQVLRWTCYGVFLLGDIGNIFQFPEYHDTLSMIYSQLVGKKHFRIKFRLSQVRFLNYAYLYQINFTSSLR